MRAENYINHPLFALDSASNTGAKIERIALHSNARLWLKTHPVGRAFLDVSRAIPQDGRLEGVFLCFFFFLLFFCYSSPSSFVSASSCFPPLLSTGGRLAQTALRTKSSRQPKNQAQHTQGRSRPRPYHPSASRPHFHHPHPPRNRTRGPVPFSALVPCQRPVRPMLICPLQPSVRSPA